MSDRCLYCGADENEICPNPASCREKAEKSRERERRKRDEEAERARERAQHARKAVVRRLMALRTLAARLKEIDVRLVGQGQRRQAAFEHTALKLANLILGDP